MLLAVEGGGFFSSSASGYSHGLALLLLGRKTEEQPVRASPWNHYRLVDRDVGHGGQLASTKDDVPTKCASFTCFGCTPASARLEGASPPKLSSSSNTPQKLSSSTTNGKGTTNGGSINGTGKKGCLKSNSKRDSSDRGSIVSDCEEPRESLEELQTLRTGMERRKVHWTDTCGKELFEIREFETSDEGLSDDEGESDGFRKCECVIQ